MHSVHRGAACTDTAASSRGSSCRLSAVLILLVPAHLPLPCQDLHRTCPHHPYIDTPPGLAALRNVLVAYSFRDSHVGYCQVREGGRGGERNGEKGNKRGAVREGEMEVEKGNDSSSQNHQHYPLLS